MKKLLAIIMAAVMIAACSVTAFAENIVTLDLSKTNSTVTWNDRCSNDGYWTMKAENDDYDVTIVGLSYPQAAGTYTWGPAMDPISTCVLYKGTSTTVSFTGGSCTVTDENDVVTVSGTFTGDDGKTYDLTITYGEAAPAASASGNSTDVSYDVQPTYTVAIPASVTLGDSAVEATITASDVILESGKQVAVELTEASNTASGSTFNAKNGESVVTYTITGDAAIAVGDTVATFTANGTKTLTFAVADKTGITVAGSHTETLTFTISVEDAALILDLATVTANTTVEDGYTIINTLAGNYKISIAGSATVTLKDVTINGTDNINYDWAGITCEGDATIILSGSNTVKGFDSYYPGINVPEGSTVTIRGDGSLNASSNGYGAGIGGGNNNSKCGNITIESGTIIATGGVEATGIGSGSGGDGACGNITITGGNVTAMGGDFAAGIGAGAASSCGNITISGGTVTAMGGDSAAGIGSGYNTNFGSTCGDITIASGVTKVTATRGGSWASSIGAGEDATCGTVTIEDGADVTQN